MSKEPLYPRDTRNSRAIYDANGRPGGCIVGRPASTDERIIVAINNQGFCSLPDETIEREDVDHAIQGIRHKIDVDKLAAALQNLARIVRSNTSSGMRITLQAISVVGIPFIFHRNRRLQRLTAEAVDEMNRTIFEPAGMYAKTQMCFIQIERYRQQTSWLSIATTPEEVAKLQDEGHVFRYRPTQRDMVELSPGCCCGCFTFLCGVRVVV